MKANFTVLLSLTLVTAAVGYLWLLTPDVSNKNLAKQTASEIGVARLNIAAKMPVTEVISNQIKITPDFTKSHSQDTQRGANDANYALVSFAASIHVDDPRSPPINPSKPYQSPSDDILTVIPHIFE